MVQLLYELDKLQRIKLGKELVYHLDKVGRLLARHIFRSAVVTFILSLSRSN